jgi:hypothetical protein
MEDPVNEIVKRTQRYWYVDGISDIGAGALFLMLGATFFLMEWLSPVPNLAWMIAIGQPLVVILGAWLVRKAVSWAKEHITYPRTGYVAYHRPAGWHRWQRVILSAMIAAGVAAGVIFLEGAIGFEWVPVISGGLLGIAMMVLSLRFRLLRFGLLALYAVLLGVFTAWLSLPSSRSAAIFFSSFGLGWAISGVVTLARYLRNTQPLGEGRE